MAGGPAASDGGGPPIASRGPARYPGPRPIQTAAGGPMTTTITICDTCKRDGWEAGRGTGATDGERLAELVESIAEGVEGVATRRHSCLMGCEGACNVALQATGKMCYTMGRFEPTEETARALVAYAARHAELATGVVPYREWPEAVKGHFVTRHPPLPV